MFNYIFLITILDTKFVAQLLLLPYLIPPKGKLNIKGTGTWKFSILECIEAIICHAKVHFNLSLEHILLVM